jgi:tetratricopeptide (TPR) repeat protein
MSLGDLFLAQHDWNHAREHYEQALARCSDIHYPLGQANTLIDLGRVRFHLGDREQGLQDVQQAATLFQQLHEDEWARRAKLSLALMQAQLDQSADTHEEDTIFDQAALLHAFLTVRSPQEMFHLVERAPHLLSEGWFTLVTAMSEATDDEDLRQALRERLDSLQTIRQEIEQSAVAASRMAEAVLAFANANWTTRRALLADPQTPLLSEKIEPIFARLLMIYKEDAHQQTLAEMRTLLRRCRTWGVDATWHFELHMRLGDGIEIPAEHEAAIGQIAALLAQGQGDRTSIEQAVAIMQALLDRLTASTPPLFEAALLRDLADTLLALPKEHPARQLQTIESYYREALPAYQEAERPVSVAFLQRTLGDILSEQGRYQEALEPLHCAFEAFQAWERYRADAAWALSAFAWALENLGRIEEAIAAYTQALTLLPDTAPLLRNRAEALILARRLSEAEADLARAVELDGNEESSYLWMRRAQLAIARGDGALGEQMLDEVLKRNPDEDVLFERAQCSGLRGEMETAQELLRGTFEKANAGDRAALCREWEQLRTEHPDLPAFPVS